MTLRAAILGLCLACPGGVGLAGDLMADLPPPDPAAIARIAACLDGTLPEGCARDWERACLAAPEGFLPCYRSGIVSWEVVRLQVLGRRIADFDAADARRAADPSHPADQPRAGDALRAAEAAFLSFRQADCASERATWAPGSSEAMRNTEDCLLRHTAAQAARLVLRGLP